jgi:hypothetical protein
MKRRWLGVGAFVSLTCLMLMVAHVFVFVDEARATTDCFPNWNHCMEKNCPECYWCCYDLADMCLECCEDEHPECPPYCDRWIACTQTCSLSLVQCKEMCWYAQWPFGKGCPQPIQ